ncbi:MAG: tetratricopeptide repeat protein [Bradymonadales bacterium]|nr:tetratricopeptide repeat protein [Bradymonadales bacterium]
MPNDEHTPDRDGEEKAENEPVETEPPEEREDHPEHPAEDAELISSSFLVVLDSDLEHSAPLMASPVGGSSAPPIEPAQEDQTAGTSVADPLVSAPSAGGAAPQDAAATRSSAAPPAAGSMTAEEPPQPQPAPLPPPPPPLPPSKAGVPATSGGKKTASPRSAAARAPKPPAPSAPQPVEKPTAIRPEDPRTARSLELVAHLQAELAANPKAQRAARLHYELARLLEVALDDIQGALKHYQRAFELAPEHLPTIRGARRTLTRLKDFRKVLPLFDAEVRNTAEVGRKAALLFAKGRLLEDQIGSRKDAREAYLGALELDPDNLSILRALEQNEIGERNWEELARTYDRLAGSLSADPRHRAALLVRRAQLLEARLNNLDLAAEVYEAALGLDRSTPGAVAGLKRIYATRRRWRELVRILEQEAALISDPELRAIEIYRAALLQDRQLSNREQAIEALQEAHRLAPTNLEVLEELVRLLERAERHEELRLRVEHLLTLKKDPLERLELTCRLGQLCEERLKDGSAAEHWYRTALEVDPGYIPALQAIERLYNSRGAWSELIDVFLAEAQASSKNPERQATAHYRIALLYEDRLSDVEQAIVHYSRALAFSPGFAAPFSALTRLFAQLGRHRDLIDLYQHAVEQASQAEQAIAYLFKIGALYEDFLNEPVQAAHVYRTILERDPKRLGAIHALQRAWDRAGRYRELVDAIELELEQAKDKNLIVELLYRAGSVLLDNLVDRERALVKLRRALEMKPGHLPTLKNLGRIYYHLGRWEDLLDTYRRELEVFTDPSTRVRLLYKMGELSEVRLGKSFQAVDFYRQAVEIDSMYRPALSALRRLLEQQERWDELNDLAEKEMEQLPDPVDRAALLYRVGVIAEERLNSPVKAIAAHERALQLHPGYRPAVDAVKRLYTEAKNFRKLAEILVQESSVSREPLLVLDALMREGQIGRDELSDPHRAIACYEAVLEQQPDCIGAMLALEDLYREVKKVDRLEQIIRAQAGLLKDPQARVTALREQARILEKMEEPDQKALQAAYHTILAISPDDLLTLTALENRALVESDHTLLAQVDQQLATATSEPDLVAAFLTRLAESQETADKPEALDTYRKAIAADPQNLAAIRGFSRMAEQLENGEALVEAAGMEADVLADRQTAARLLFQAAVLARSATYGGLLTHPPAREDHADRLSREALAARHLERALEVWPDHVQAAEMLVEILSQPQDRPRLVDLLTRAAESARAPDRRAALWRQVATIQEEEQNDLAGAIRSLQKLLRLTPDDAEFTRKLADLFMEDGRWLEAARTLERFLELSSGQQKQQKQLLLAEICADRLDDPKRAMGIVKAVLDAEPTNRVALLRNLELQARTGQVEKAALSSRKLLKSTQDPSQRAALLLRLGRFEHQLGRRVAAAEAFEEALSVEGPQGEAAREYQRLVEDVGSHTRYAGALERYLQRCESENRPDLEAYLQLSRLQADQLKEPPLAVATLTRAISLFGPSRPLRTVLARRLREANRFEEALGESHRLIQEDPSQADGWRGLSQTYLRLGRPIEAAMALEPVAILDRLDDREAEVLQARREQPSPLPPKSLPAAAMPALGEEDSRWRGAAELLQALLETMSKVLPVDLAGRGLTNPDRLADSSGHPLRKLTNRLASAFDFREFELYSHRTAGRGITIELGYPPALLVPQSMTSLPAGGQLYMLAQPMAYLARGLHPLWTLSAIELETYLAAAARLVDSRFRTSAAGEQKLDEFQRRLSRAIPRRARRPLEEAAQRYAAGPAVSFDLWMAQVERTSARVALLAADNLVETIAALKEQEPQLAALEGAELVKQSNRVADLFRFWLSEAAVAAGVKMGRL